jgi:hypothetical protein
MHRLMRPLSLVSGALMVGMGVLVLSGVLAQLAVYAPILALP